MRDARGHLADGGKLLGVGERALDRDGARQQLGRVEQRRELVGDRVEPLVVRVAEAGAEEIGRHEQLPPAPARAGDRDDRHDIGLDQGVAERERQLAEPAESEGIARAGDRIARPGRLDRLHPEGAVHDASAVGEEDRGAPELQRPTDLGERAPAALDDPELG